MTRTATCRCRAVAVVCAGEPQRVSVCHCLSCQQRSGSAFAAQARFERDRVTVDGETRTYECVGDSGNSARFHFCPSCGSTAWYETQGEPDLIAVPIGNFADPTAFGPPLYSVYEERKLAWVAITSARTEHYD